MQNEIVLYNVKDIEKIFKCGQKKAYQLMNANGFPSIKINAAFVVEKEALLQWLSKNKGKEIIL